MSGTSHWGKWIGLGISAWTKIWNWNTKSLSHVELWMQDKQGYFDYVATDPVSEIEYEQGYLGDMFTSTMGQIGGQQGPFRVVSLAQSHSGPSVLQVSRFGCCWSAVIMLAGVALCKT